MEIIRDQRKVMELVKKGKINRYFDAKDLPFVICRYGKGEVLSAPDAPLQDLLFLVDGVVQVYGILDDGSKLSFRMMSKPALLGDVEFCDAISSPLFSEAMTEVTCLALPMEVCRKVLYADIKFLHTLLHALAEKLVLNSKADVETPTVEERVLYYMENVFENHTLCGIEEAMIQLRCSRRQLQRVLKKLCDEGKIERRKKGCYQLR